VRVRNRPLHRAIGSFLAREAAQGCEVRIDFYRWDTGTRAFGTIAGRWSSHPEPLRWVPNPPIAAVPNIGGTAIIQSGTGGFAPAFDATMIRREQDVGVNDAGEEVAVAVLLAGDSAYGWTSESYAHPAWANPALRLDHGTYRVVVRVSGSSVEHQQEFKLEYLGGDFARFHLVAA
jgi:hypothetical protein